MSDLSTDLLVAGGGAAGLAAALAASDRGLEVVVVDAKETFRHGSNTAMSTSMVPAGGSRWQEAEAIDDSPDRFLSDVQAGISRSSLRRAETRLPAQWSFHLAPGCHLVDTDPKPIRASRAAWTRT